MRTDEGFGVAARPFDPGSRLLEMMARTVDAARPSGYIADVEIGGARLRVGRDRIERDDMAALHFVQSRRVRGLDIVSAPVHTVDDQMQSVAHLIPGQPLVEHA